MSVLEASAPAPAASRARYPDAEGLIERDGVRVFWESYGEGEPLLLMPAWSIVPSRLWKAQIPYLARRYKVVVFDGRGNGRSDRPAGKAAYLPEEFMLDALAVMDAAGIERAAVLSKSRGAQWTLKLAAKHPERVNAAVFVAPGTALTHWPPFESLLQNFEEPSAARRKAAALRTAAGSLPMIFRSRPFRLFARSTSLFDSAVRFSAAHARSDQADFVEWFARLVYVEPHSTRQIEQAIEWGLDTDPATLTDSLLARHPSPEEIIDLCKRVRCPSLVIHGTDDLVCPFDWGEALAAQLGARLIAFEGTGHAPGGRQPVRFNHALRDFLAEVYG